MSPRRVWAMARKEFLHVWRDARSLGMAVAIPVMLLVLYGYALTLDVDHVPLVVWDQSESPASRALLSHFFGSPYFALTGHVQGYPAIEAAIDGGHALAALVIPADFSRQRTAGHPTRVQFLLDGSDANTAGIALGYAEIVTLTYATDVMLQASQRAGRGTPTRPLDLRARVWYNPELQSRHYLIPGLIAVIMMVIAALLTSLTVAREWECGTMEQLISTPVRAAELVLGKLVPYFVIGMADVALAVAMGQWLFAVPLRGSAALVFGLAAVFLAGTLSMGLLISILSRNQLVANQVAMVLTFLPAFLLSGFVFAVVNMPRPLQLVTYLVPARYFIALLRGVYLKGVGLEILAGEAVLLAGFGAVMLGLANVTFRKKLE